jgi:hypothetical protein
MSVLSMPRIYFNGATEWNPNTTNNDDQWPTYDYVNAELNWAYLATQNPPITRANFQQLFPTWVQTPQYYQSSGGGWWQPPAEWNYYGGNEATLYAATTNQQTLVSGGQTACAGPVIRVDPLVGATVNIVGHPYAGASTPTLPRLVDVNPAAFWTTSYFFKSFQIGTTDDPAQFLYGEVTPDTLPCTRWMNVQRNMNVDNGLEIAGVAGIAMQVCLPNDTVVINAGGTGLLHQLDDARRKPGVNGIMVRISIYTTRYFVASAFHGCTGKDQQYARLVVLWQQALQSGQTPPQNPAVSRVVGTVGLWQGDELATMPGGRYLVPNAALLPRNVPSTSSPTPLGPAIAELNASEGFLSLDLGGAIPETTMAGTKADFGPLTVELQPATGTSRTIGTLTSAAYDQASYETTAGIVDLPLPADITPADVRAGTLSVVAGKTATSSGTALLSETALSKDALTVQTDQRSIWLDQQDTGSLTIQVRQRGQVPTQTVNVLVAQYQPSPPPPAANASLWVLPSATDPATIGFSGIANSIITVPPSANGVAQLQFTPIRPGFPNIVFFPFLPGEPVPTPPPQIIPVFNPGAPLSITSAFYSSVRVMPFDDALPLAFANLWNSTHSPTDAWNFVYNNILYVYDMLFPVMKYYAGIDFSQQDIVNDNIDLIVQLTSSAMLDTSVYMPVTRDLSVGKRAVLQMYGFLVDNNWPEAPIGPPNGYVAAPAPGLVGVR